MAHHFGPIPARSKLPGMRTLTSNAADAGGMPDPIRAAALAAEPRLRSGFGSVAPAVGGLAAAAAVAVAAFFGVGLVLLTGRPADWIRLAPPATQTRPASAVSRSAAEGTARATAPHDADAAVGASDAGPATQGPRPAPTASIPSLQAAAPPLVAPPPAATFAGRAAASADHGTERPTQSAALPPPGAPAKPPDMNQPPAKPESATPQPAPQSEMTAPLSPAEIDTLLAQGDDAFREGDLTSARLYYLRAFGAGDGRGALGLGASYDPEFLNRFHLWTQHADPAEARTWYLRARQLGAPGADSRLVKLGEKAPQ